MTRRHGALLLPLIATAALAHAADAPWPETVATVEQMRPLRPPSLRIQTWKNVDRTATSRLVLHLHVDAGGVVQLVRLDSASGSPAIDEAMLAAARALRFEPYRVGGVAQAVTLVMPVTVPFRERGRLDPISPRP